MKEEDTQFIARERSFPCSKVNKNDVENKILQKNYPHELIWDHKLNAEQ